MKTIADIKAKYGEKVIETGTSFIVNEFGKYKPNISFVLNKEFSGDPLEYRNDFPTYRMIAGMGIDFDSNKTEAIFGDFWLSKAEKPHFRPKGIETASHMLIRADWGGAFSSTRGQYDGPEGTLHFRRASSNGGGSGYDFYVLPLGYQLIVRDEEIDGEVIVVPDFSARAKEIRADFAAFDKAEAEKAAAAAKAKAEAEQASREARPEMVKRLETVRARLVALQIRTGKNYPEVIYREIDFEFSLEKKLHYTEKNVAWVEKTLKDWEAEFDEQEAYRTRQHEARTRNEKKFQAHSSRVENLGMKLEFKDTEVWLRLTCGGVNSFEYTRLDSFLERIEGFEKQKARIEAFSRSQVVREEDAIVPAPVGVEDLEDPKPIEDMKSALAQLQGKFGNK
jgi:hypothetical protein